ncbi:MAG TPA: hypothetical protein VFA02_03495, partial [Pseudacidobacterium sp.]|nr:hypothetical protein [Pseudacidobacterium sp.]
YAYRCQGPDQRDFSPETETGNFDTKKGRARQDLLQFAENKPEDRRVFAGIDEFVAEKLAGRADGRMGPFAVARIFADSAARTRILIHAMPHPTGRAAGEWRLLRTDLLAASLLGDYYASRITGMTHLDFALHANSKQDYNIALRSLAQSRMAWKQLGETTDAVYRPLSNPLRHQLEFTWSSQNAPLAELDATAEKFWMDRNTSSSHLPLTPKASDMKEAGLYSASLESTTSGNTATVRCFLSSKQSASAVVLWWKPLPSELSWQSVPMRQVDHAWTATVPLNPRGLMYMVEVKHHEGEAENLPDETRETPYRIIQPFLRTRN